MKFKFLFTLVLFFEAVSFAANFHEIYYDNGEGDVAASPWSNKAGGMLAVAFELKTKPAKLKAAKIYITKNGSPKTSFRVKFFDGSFELGPLNQILTNDIIAQAESLEGQWVTINLSQYDLEVKPGVFFIAMEWLTPPGEAGQNAQFACIDIKSPPADRSWWKHTADTPWAPISKAGLKKPSNIMIRAIVSTH